MHSTKNTHTHTPSFVPVEGTEIKQMMYTTVSGMAVLLCHPNPKKKKSSLSVFDVAPRIFKETGEKMERSQVWTWERDSAASALAFLVLCALEPANG